MGLQGGVVDDRRPAGGERLQAGAGGEGFLVVFQDLGDRVRGAGPAQLALGVGEHDPGGVNREQLLGRDHGLLQGGGQVPLGVQGGEGGDAFGQQSGVDRHERVSLVPVAELANPVNRPGEPPGCRSGPTAHNVVVWASAGSCDSNNKNQPWEHTPLGRRASTGSTFAG